MSGYRLAGALACCVLTTALAGCGVFRTHRPVTIQVIDGETRQPLSDAKLSVYYPNMLDFTAPLPTSGVTDEQGLVTLRIGDYHSIELRGELADHYQLSPHRISRESVVGLPRKPMRQISHTVELWKLPAPKIEVIVPDGYRGPVKVVYETAPPETYEPGRREFTFRSDRSGRVTVVGPAYLDGFLSVVSARYESGAVIPLPSANRPEEVAFRWVHGNSLPVGRPSDLFIVGTEAEDKALWRQVHRQIGYNTWQNDREAYARVFAE